MNFIDLHCDTALLLHENGGELYKNNYSVDIQKLQEGKALAQFFAMFVEKKSRENPFFKFEKMVSNFKSELDKNKEHITLVKTLKELEDENLKGKIGAFISIEEGEVLEGNPLNVKKVYDMGVRAITLTWNFENSIGYPNFNISDFKINPFGYRENGLKNDGKDIVVEMERVGIIPDASHLSDRGFWDLIDICKKPFVATHSNAREITLVPRNMSDDMIKALSNKGGVMGINFCANFLGDTKNSTVEQMVSHIKHIKNVGGIDVLALGSDFDGIGNKVEIENISQMDKLVFALEKCGFTMMEIEKIFYKNVKRVLKDTIG
ncbi:MAG: dipeptidase [Clostridium sp.]